jgi:hypothetical protein
MSARELHRFQQIVLADTDLERELRGCLDRASFIALVIERARQHDCAVEPADIDAAFSETARNWITRGAER